MITKNRDELFVFESGATQSYPNTTSNENVTVVKASEYAIEPKDNSAQEGYEWAKSELESSDIEIKYHYRGSKRAKLTIQDWYDYQEELRDYATCDDNGNYSIRTDKPINPTEA